MTELVLISDADERGLVAEMSRVIGFIDRVPEATLADIALTCSLTLGESVIAIVASSTADLRARLVSARNRLAAGGVDRLRDKSGTYYFRRHLLGEDKDGKLAFIYPGVMSFYPDMMRDLAMSRDVFRAAFDELEEAMTGESYFTPSSFIFPPAACYRHDADVFRSGAYAQALVATYSGCAAMTRLLRTCGVAPDGVVGFAGGDLAAMMCSGAAGVRPNRNDRVKIIRDIYDIVHKAVNHGGYREVAMVTVLLRRPDEIDWVKTAFPPDKVMLAVDFSPRQKTYAIDCELEDEVLAAFARAGVRAVKLALDRPFNTPMCKELVPHIRSFATRWMKHEPVHDAYSCTTATRITGGLKALRADTAERWAKPIRFGDTVRKMYEDGYRVFLEVGPRGLMTAAVADTLRDEEHAAIAVNSIHRGGREQFLHALAQLIAQGAIVDISSFFEERRAKRVDFDSAVSLEVRKDSEMRLSRRFPKLSLLSDSALPRSDGPASSALAVPTGKGARAAARAAAVAQQARRQRQFDFGAMNPLVSDADVVAQSPGVSLEITKTFKIDEMPFIGDFALGTSQISYSDPNLRGLTLFTLPLGAEIAAEVAGQVVPNRIIVALEDLVCRRWVSFDRGCLTLFVRAERVAAGSPGEVAVKVQIRDDSPNSAYTWPVMEVTCIFASAPRASTPLAVGALSRPRSVHWSGRDIYPQRICFGKRLRGIQFVDAWGEDGLDYRVTVPPLAGNVNFTRFPQWSVNPVLMGIVASGFQLWRSHERFVGAFSFPFRMRRMDIVGFVPKEGATLKCYMRHTGVTPKSHICDMSVTDGNGKLLGLINGWEELTERYPAEYCNVVYQPATSFLSESFAPETMGADGAETASAFITDVPYAVFERNDELWLKTLSHVVLSVPERRQFADMTGSTSRRAEWLFGRVAAKEAVRKFMRDVCQARWSDADINIWADDSGKPHALGSWRDYLTVKLDIAIAHTSQFVVAVAAANRRVGVDVESLSRSLSEEFAEGVFTPSELAIAANTADAARSSIRFWCAKEAVSKALGTGIRYSPRELVVVDYDDATGRLTVRLEGGWLDAFKNFRGRDIPVTVRSVRDHALAFCFIPAALFNDDE